MKFISLSPVIGLLFWTLFSQIGLASDLTIVNRAGVSARIDRLVDNCGGVLVPYSVPLYLADGEEVVFRNITQVLHHYTVCANGWCSGSAIGIETDETYMGEIRLMQTGQVELVMTPDLWPGKLECQ